MKKFLCLLLSVVVACAYLACSDDDDSVVTSPVAIYYNGVEVQDNEVLLYDAAENIFGEIEAGDDNEPTFVAKSPCNLEVTVTVPQHKLDKFKWCGITDACSIFAEPGIYTRTKENFATKMSMGLHAYFLSGVYTSCLLKVEVTANNKAERTFYLRYDYQNKANPAQ